MSKNELIDLGAFDTVSACEEGELKPFVFKGKETGAAFRIVGKHSQRVREHEKAKAVKMARKSARAEKTKATLELLEEIIETQDDRSIEDAVVRVTGWVGVKGEYSADAMREFLKRNPQEIDSIIDFSNQESNFTKAL